MVIARDDRMVERMKVLRNHGMEPKYYHTWVGGNFRLDTLQAAILLKKLPYLANWSERRWKIAQHYRSEFANIASELRLQDEPYAKQLGERGHIYHQFVIRTSMRDELREHLRDRGIGTEIYYPVPLHMQQALKGLGYKEGDFPEAERAAREVLALPIFPELREDEQQTVVAAIAEFLG